MLTVKRTLTSTLVSAVLCSTAIARDLPNIDVLSDAPAAKASAAQARFGGQSLSASAATTLQNAQARNLIAGPASVHMHAALGVPSFVWANESLPKAGIAAVRPAAQASVAAQNYLRKYAALYGVDSNSLSGAELADIQDSGDGPIIARYTQKLAGLEVYDQELTLALKRDFSLLALSGTLSPRAAQRFASDASTASRDAAFQLSAHDAVARAFADLGGKLDAATLRDLGSKHGFTQISGQASGAYRLSEPALAKKVWFDDGTQLLPAYQLEVLASEAGSTHSEAYAYVLSATDGRILKRSNLIARDSFGYRVFADTQGNNLPWDGPQGRYGQPNANNGQPGPLPSAAALFKPANLVVLEHGPISTRDPWLAPGATTTSGNNVSAYVDAAAPDGFGTGDFRADINSSASGVRSFDYTLDPTKPADAGDAQRRAAVVQMFYLNNWLHDWFYDAGFNEASGNAQLSNYGRGGREGDPILAEAQDYSGANNANMLARTDGSSPRMQMYFFTQAVADTSAGKFGAQGSSFGPQSYNLSGTLARFVDAAGGDHACGPAANPEALKGKIALIQRGSADGTACNFVLKAKSAQDAGAIGLIVYNNVNDSSVPGMGGTDATLTIPGQGISRADGLKIIEALGQGAVSAKLTIANNRDSSVDTLIMAHEWGHYISNRLIRNSLGLTNNQGRSMGEGWGDFHSLLLTVEKEDANVLGNQNFGGVYAQGGYADINTSRLGASNTFYWGIRRVPYTVDMSKNGLTFKHIQNGIPLPTQHTVQSGADGANNAEVHNAGEVWATMLWECYVNLLNNYEFSVAQDKMKRYLVAGYKLTPSQPTFVEARDALLAAARASSETDAQLFLKGFAKRGLGIGAVAPDKLSTTHEGVVESFSIGDGNGGGGTGSVPVVVVSAPAQVNAGAAVVLDASGSTDADGASLSYLWKQTAGTPVSLSGANTAKASFTAGSSSEIVGFSVTVSKTVNGKTVSASKTLTVEVKASAVVPPTVVISAPATVNGLSTVVLDGSGSRDSSGSSLSYRWTQVAGNSVSLTGSSSAKASFTAANANETLRFALTVTNSKGVSSTSETTVQVKALSTDVPGVAAPTANAGADLTARPDSRVYLSGSSSRSADGTPLTYRWTQVSGTPVTISAAQLRTATLRTPKTIGRLSFRLTVTDIRGRSSSDTVNVYVY